MISHEKLEVYPTGRCIRERTLSTYDQILPNMLTAQEFFDKTLIIPGFAKISPELRKTFLHQAIQSLDLSPLGFEHTFSRFLESSEFLFLFFDELHAENITIQEIERSDTYAEFDDHLQLLQTIHARYASLLKEHGLYDHLAMDDFDLNTTFFSNFVSIDFYLEGYLPYRERAILRQLSTQMPTHIHFHVHPYNTKTLQSFVAEQWCDSLKPGSYYLNITNNTIETTAPPRPVDSASVIAFPKRLDQAAFVFEQLQQWIENDQISPESIAIILPDESFAPLLRQLDHHHNLNFAMGFSLQENDGFKTLQLLYDALLDKPRAAYWIAQLDLKETLQTLNDSHRDNALQGYIDWLDAYTRKHPELQDFLPAHLHLLGCSGTHLAHLALTELLGFTLQHLSEQRTDDVRGGRVTVMGVLESRLLEFDAVIILDANRGILPKPSEKDIFLNSKIRSLAGLPTSKERENLQKGYYYRLLQNSRHAIITYVDDESHLPSPFLEELNLPVATSPISITQLFPDAHELQPWDSPITQDIRLADLTFSFSQLKNYLDCSLRYYLRHIAKIREPIPAPDEIQAYELGHLFHQILHDIHPEIPSMDASALQQKITRELQQRTEGSPLFYEAIVLSKRLSPFITHEIARHRNGVQILAHEQSFEVMIEDIRFTGQLDRIERASDGLLRVVDYKLKRNLRVDTPRTVANSTDFQLTIYQRAAQQLYPGHDFTAPAFYDIYGGKLVEEPLLEVKTALLATHLKDLHAPVSVFTKQTVSLQRCRYCDYREICNR